MTIQLRPFDLLSLAWTAGRLDQGVDRRTVLRLGSPGTWGTRDGRRRCTESPNWPHGESGDQAILACSAIYQSFALGEVVGHPAALRTLEAARSLVPGQGDQATRAWLTGRRAEEAAALGDTSARRLIEEATTLMADACPQSERPWTRCLESPRMSHMRLTIATRLGDQHGVHDELDGLLMLANDPAQKRTGRMLATIGLALTRIGDADEGVRFGERAVEAVRVSGAAYAAGRLSELGAALRYGSSARSRALRTAIGVTCRELASPRPSTAGTTQGPR